MDETKSSFEETRLFVNVEISLIAAEDLKNEYKRLHNRHEAEFRFPRHSIIPDIPDVTEAFIGIVSCKELLNLIEDENGSLNRNLYYDNVRDFLGENSVNRGIEESLTSFDEQDKFVLFNNGITIVARESMRFGERFKLTDYQIVNGCQTTNIIYKNREKIGDHQFVPLKLIVSQQSEIINKVIQGTNRQTEVTMESFESLTEFQKKLEDFFLALASKDSDKDSLYYERRSKQYDYMPIKKRQIITITAMTKCFLAIMLQEPHSTHRYYGEILKAYKGRIFLDSHEILPYYLSARMFADLERTLTDADFPIAARKFRFHILLIARLSEIGIDVPNLNDARGMSEYCHRGLELLDRPQADRMKMWLKSWNLVKSIVGDRIDETNIARSRDLTSELLTAVGDNKIEKEGGSANLLLSDGWIKFAREDSGWGFISRREGSDIFFHFDDIVDDDLWTVTGTEVEFTVVEMARGPRAVGVARKGFF